MESNIKKGTFLAEVIRELELAGTRVLISRYEELGEELAPLDYVCSRAVGEFATFLGWAGSPQVSAARVAFGSEAGTWRRHGGRSNGNGASRSRAAIAPAVHFGGEKRSKCRRNDELHNNWPDFVISTFSLSQIPALITKIDY